MWNIKNPITRMIETSNRLTLAYKLENPQDWSDFETQQSKVHRRTENVLLIGTGLLLLMLGAIAQWGADKTEPLTNQVFRICVFITGMNFAPILMALRPVHEPILDHMGLHTMFTLHRGYKSAMLLAMHHRTSLTSEITNAWQVEGLTLTREYQNQLLQGQTDAIIQTAFVQKKTTLLTSAMDYLDKQKAGGSLSKVTSTRRPIQDGIPMIDEGTGEILFLAVPAIRPVPEVVYNQDILPTNDDTIEMNKFLIEDYLAIKAQLIRARSLVPHLSEFEVLAVRLRELGQPDPINAKILAYHNFCKKASSSSFTEHEANFLLSSNETHSHIGLNELPLSRKKKA